MTNGITSDMNNPCTEPNIPRTKILTMFHQRGCVADQLRLIIALTIPMRKPIIEQDITERIFGNLSEHILTTPLTSALNRINVLILIFLSGNIDQHTKPVKVPTKVPNDVPIIIFVEFVVSFVA